MAFDRRNFELLALSTTGSSSIYSYVSDVDTIYTIVTTPNYFANTINPQMPGNYNNQLLNSGDIIYVTDVNGFMYTLAAIVNGSNNTANVSVQTPNTDDLQVKMFNIQTAQQICAMPDSNSYLMSAYAVADAAITVDTLFTLYNYAYSSGTPILQFYLLAGTPLAQNTAIPIIGQPEV